MLQTIRHIFFIGIFAFAFTFAATLTAQIRPVVISEVFYDTPLEEDAYNAAIAHHNGEFIELYNPTAEDIDISEWQIRKGNGAGYVFPQNVLIHSKEVILVAYKYPYTNFELKHLFPNIPSGTPVYYHNSMMLNNKHDIISLYDKNYNLIDQMSYQYGVSKNYWNIRAHNGKRTNNWRSIQRGNISWSVSSIRFSVNDYFSGTPTPGSANSSVLAQTVASELYPDGSSNPIENDAIGNIAGIFDISSTGAATYTIPIECPAGIQGMQPNISLVYNSQGGDGNVGWGWNIAGLSTIMRTTKDFHFDKIKSGIDWTKESPLSLDGQRLKEVYRWGNDSAQYLTEMETYSRIIGYQLQNWGPSFFKVYTKEGKIIQYGNPSNLASYIPLMSVNFSRPTTLPFTEGYLGWRISSIQDYNGNYVEYQYNHELTTLFSSSSFTLTAYFHNVLKKISYGGNRIAQTPHTLELLFNYDTDAITEKYIGGTPYINSKRLKNIEIRSSGTLLNKYVANYSHYDGKAHLTSLDWFNGSGEKINPITFEWSKNTYEYASQGNITYAPFSLFQQQGYNNNTKQLGILYGDLDGDGIVDAVAQYRLEKKYYKNGWNEFWNVFSYDYKYIWVAYKNNGSGKFIPIHEQEYDADEGGESIFLLIDKDGDGKDELYIGNFKDSFFFDIYKYVNGSFNNNNTPEYYSLPTKYVMDNLNLSALVADFKGNGTPQILFLYKKKDKKKYFTVPVNNREEQMHVHNITEMEYAKYYVADFTGDGKANILQVKSDTKNPEFKLYELQGYNFECIFDDPDIGINGYDKIYPGDFNGDGSADLLVRKNLGYMYKWKIFLSTGYDFVENETFTNSLTSKLAENAIVFITDINKDGKSDIMVREPGATSVQAYIKLFVSTGRSFEQKLSQLHSGSYFTGFATMGRINNDKFDDILLTHYGSLSSPYPYIKISNNIKFDKIIKISDSYQNTTQIGYDLYSTNQLKVHQSSYDSDNTGNNTLTTLNRGDWDIASTVVSRDANNNQIGSIQYGYDSVYIHKQGKGILGYKNITVIDFQNNLKTTTFNKLNTTHYILYPVSNITYLRSNNSVISKDSAVYNLSTSDKWHYSLLPSKRFETNVLNNTYSETVYNKYDWSGNPTSITTTFGKSNDPNKIIENQNFSYGNRGAWCSNKILSATYERIQGSETHTRTSNYEYDNKGNLTKETTDPNDENKVVTEYKNLNAFGQPQQVEVTANNTTRTTSQTYTPSGRFITSKTDVLGQAVTYNWDEKRGLLQTRTDPWGNKTSYTYDSFGRLKETLYPDRKNKVQTVKWATAQEKTNYPGAKYYTFSQLSGSAPVYTWFDALDREICTQSYGLNEKRISVFTEYNSQGRKYRVSEPKFDDDDKSWAATYAYDTYGRPETVKTKMGTTTYGYNGLTTTVTTPEGKKETTLNAAGQILTSKVNGKTVNYTYYASGLTKTATPEGGQPISMEYDLQGNRIKLTDPNAGLIRSAYNGFGELLWTKQKIHLESDTITTENIYYPNGLLKKIDRNGEVTTYTYDNHNRISTIEIAGQHKQTFTYDHFDRITNLREEIDNKTFDRATGYDAFGRVKKETYPTGYYTQNEYDKYGNLTLVTDKDDREIWKLLEENAKRQITQEKKGGKITTRKYDDRGFPTYLKADGITDMSWEFNAKGNLNYRKEAATGQREDFEYDLQNRLTQWKINNATEFNIVYGDNMGNITQKTDLGDFTMNYGENGKPHALTSIDGVPERFPSDSLFITYTDFKKIKTLTEGKRNYALTYGVDEQRRKSVYKQSVSAIQPLQQTSYYFGDYEEVKDTFLLLGVTNTKKIHYLRGGAIYITSAMGSGEPEGVLYYGYYDYLGSLIALANENGTVAQRYAYDPWGARRDPSNWSQSDNRTSWLINRGYTGHEHLYPFGGSKGACIINMNGRVYDPLTASFFSPDPYVQMPDNWLNYNRYLYAYGNPLVYTDPTGEIVWFVPVIIGAVIGTYMGGTIANNNYNPAKWDWSSGKTWGYMAGGAVVGGLAGWAGGAIAASGIPMANTAAIGASSLINSVGTWAYTGGQTPISISLGAISYDFTNNNFGYLGKKGNKWYENLGYGLGALANVSDILTGFRPQKVDLVTENSDAVGHSAIVEQGSATGTGYGNGNPAYADPNGIISVGPNRYTDPSGSWHWMKGTNHWDTHTGAGETYWRQTLNVNKGTITKYANWLNAREAAGKLHYSLEISSCVSHTSRALNLSGIFNIGIHPYLLNAQMYLWSSGIRPWTYSYFLNQ